MPPRPKFSTEDSVKIVEWWCELKDIHKVRWRYAKEKGTEKFPRKLPARKNFKCVIERFKNTASVQMWSLWTRRRSGEPSDVRPRAELCIKMDGGHSTK